jgi:hypothetical protein
VASYAQESTGPGSAGATAAAPQAAPRPAAARREPGRPGSLDVSVSVLWLAPSSLGSREATLIANNQQGTDFRFFDTSGEFDGSAGFEARAGYHFTRQLAVEGGLTYARPGITVTISDDAENAPGATLSGDAISQFFIDATLVFYPLPRGAAKGRLRPFVVFGAGYLRELHGQSSATSGYYAEETGQVYHVGGGATYYFGLRPSGLLKGYGLRFDGRYYFRRGGFTFGGEGANTFTAGAGLVLAF